MFLCIEINEMSDPLRYGPDSEAFRRFLVEIRAKLRPTEIHVDYYRRAVMANIPASDHVAVDTYIRERAECYRQKVKEICFDADFQDGYRGMLEVWELEDLRQKEEEEREGGEWHHPRKQPVLVLV